MSRTITEDRQDQAPEYPADNNAPTKIAHLRSETRIEHDRLARDTCGRRSSRQSSAIATQATDSFPSFTARSPGTEACGTHSQRGRSGTGEAGVLASSKRRLPGQTTTGKTSSRYIDQARLVNRAGKLPAAVDLQLTIRALLELADLIDDVTVDDCGVSPVGLRIGH